MLRSRSPRSLPTGFTELRQPELCPLPPHPPPPSAVRHLKAKLHANEPSVPAEVLGFCQNDESAMADGRARRREARRQGLVLGTLSFTCRLHPIQWQRISGFDKFVGT